MNFTVAFQENTFFVKCKKSFKKRKLAQKVYFFKKQRECEQVKSEPNKCRKINSGKI